MSVFFVCDCLMPGVLAVSNVAKVVDIHGVALVSLTAGTIINIDFKYCVLLRQQRIPDAVLPSLLAG